MTDLLSNDPMKTDPQVLRRLREERSWTQEHLAAVSGVSLRTIQRIEREGSASAESRLSLASAFGVDVSVLAVQTEVTHGASSHPAEPEPLRSASEMGGDWHSFFRHLAIYLLVGVFFVYRDWSNDHTLHWAHWPLLGWGIGLATHGWKTWSRRSGPPAMAFPAKSRTFGERYGVFLAMSVVFVGIDLASSGRLTWAFYPILGWGGGLLLAGVQRRRGSLHA